MFFIAGPTKLYVGASVCNVSSAVTLTPASSSSVTMGTGSSTDVSLNYVGISQSGFQVSIQGQNHPIYTDEYGGNEGTPAELLLMSQSGTISGDLVDYASAAMAALIRSGVNSSDTAEGLVPSPGTALFGGNLGFAVALVGVNESYLFPKCDLNGQPRSFKLSSTEEITQITFNAYTLMGLNGSRPGQLYVRVAQGFSSIGGCQEANYSTAASGNS